MFFCLFFVFIFSTLLAASQTTRSPYRQVLLPSWKDFDSDVLRDGMQSKATVQLYGYGSTFMASKISIVMFWLNGKSTNYPNRVENFEPQ